MTQKELKSLLPLWQKILRLQDWDITFEVRYLDEDYGSCSCDMQDKTASLEILELSHPRWKLTKKIPEIYLVHELLHVMLWPLVGNKEDQDINKINAEEQVVNFLADALVKLRHEEE